MNTVQSLFSELEKTMRFLDEEILQRRGEGDFLPIVRRSLAEIKASLEGPLPDVERRKKAAGGLGRIVTDDYEFSESELGGKILGFLDKYATEVVGIKK